MTHFLSKADIIDWLVQNCPRKAIVRALEDGTPYHVEFLGGFSLIPPSQWPGWIVKVTSVHGGKWNVAVLANNITHDYEIRIIKSVPWKNWFGTNPDGNLRIELFCGDNPEKYKELRDG